MAREKSFIKSAEVMFARNEAAIGRDTRDNLIRHFRFAGKLLR